MAGTDALVGRGVSNYRIQERIGDGMGVALKAITVFPHYVNQKEGTMKRERALKAVMVLLGLLFLAGVYPVVDSLWHANHAMYADDMMLSLYVTLGIFLLLAVRNPAANRSLIAFAAWSSFAHGAVMGVMAFQKADERKELLIAVAVLGIIGVILIALAPGKPSGEPAMAAGA